MRYAIGLVLLWGIAPNVDAAWPNAPLKEWENGKTLEAVSGAKEPFGAWTEHEGGLLAIGTARCWSTRLAPGDPGADTQVTVRFNVQSSSKESGSLTRYPPSIRWGHHWYESAPGWDVGVVLRWTDALSFYRIQLSGHRGELALWDSTGAFLQRIACPVKLNETHRLDIIVRGPHFQAALDGSHVLDYWDRSVPHARGRVGLAVWRSRVRFDEFTVVGLKPAPGPLPKHEPSFRLAPDGKQAWVYDGHEPICRFVKGSPNGPEILHAVDVKLKPGNRPAYYGWIGPGIRPSKDHHTLWLVGELPAAFDVQEAGSRLRFRFRQDEPNVAKATQECTISYDESRDVYRYTFDAQMQFTHTSPMQMSEFELFDPLTYNNREAGPEVRHRWNWAGHRWHVFLGQDRKLQRYPLIDYLGAYNGQPTHWGQFTTFLYPDPAACPAFEVDLKWQPHAKRTFQLGLCHWGYDFHHVERGYGVEVEPGSRRAYTLTLTALPPAEAQALYERSVVATKVAASTDRFANFDPSGCTFAETSTRWAPTHTMVWEAGAPDPTVGRRDSHSLRIDGPDKASVRMYQYAVEQNADKWWVRGWFRTRAVGGRGLQLRVKYAYQPKPQQIFYLDGRGDCDWTYFSFVTDVLKQRDCTDISVELDGPGTAWIDDIAISAILDNKTPKTTSVDVPADLASRQDLLIDLPMSVKPGRGVYDASHNGHHLMLEGDPEWMREDGRGFLRLDGVGDGGFIHLRPTLEPRGRGHSRQFPLDAFSYEVWIRPRPLPAENLAKKMTIFHYRHNPVMRLQDFTSNACTLYYQNDLFEAEEVRFEEPIELNCWHDIVATHASGKVVLYVDGKPVGQAAYKPEGQFNFFAYHWKYAVGFRWFDRTRCFRGDLGPVRLYTKALSADEVAERFRTGF
jgi:hypothetical protein